MFNRKAKAFTLVELLVVIGIIALLVSILVPTLNRAKEIAKRGKCRANVRNIVTAVIVYSNDTLKELPPLVPLWNSGDEKDRNKWRTWDTRIGSNRNSNPFTIRNPRNVSSNFWLLVRGRFSDVGHFLCPSADDVPDSNTSDVNSVWDFYHGRNISYGLQNPYGDDWPLNLSINEADKVAWVADGSPYVLPDADNNPGKIGSKPIVNWAGTDSLDAKKLSGNSPNHNREGQAVGYADGHAEWRDTANCGYLKDNIYSASPIGEETSEAGVLNSASRNNPMDSMIIP